MARVRRSRKDVVTENISKIDEKIAELTQKIEKLNLEKTEFSEELSAIEAEEARLESEKRDKDMLSFIKKNNITKEQLQSFINAKENKTEI